MRRMRISSSVMWRSTEQPAEKRLSAASQASVSACATRELPQLWRASETTDVGKTGKNFAAGMSGGIAYVLDEDNDLYTRMNKEMVFSQEISNKYDVMELKDMIKEHVALTNSEKGKKILDNFSEYLPKFKKVIPYDYNRMLMAIVQMEEKGLSSEQAQIEAFYANTRG